MAISVLRSRYLHRRARRIAAKCEASSLRGLRELGVEGQRWRKRIIERWAFALVSVLMARFLVLVAFFTFGFIYGYGFIFRALYRFFEAQGGNLHLLEAEGARAGFKSWYDAVVAVVVLLMVYVVVFYAVMPLKVLIALGGDETRQAKLHRESLRQLERRSRAALMLYAQAAQCGHALAVSGWVRSSLARNACVMPLVESEIRQAWKKARPGTTKPSRHQKAELKNHAGRVIAALRAVAVKVDADPEVGVRELGIMLVRIGDRLVEGRVGALLEEGELEGYEPVRDREILRTVVAVLLVAASAVGVALFQLPAGVAGPLTTATGLIVLVTVYRKAAKGVETVALLLGGK